MSEYDDDFMGSLFFLRMFAIFGRFFLALKGTTEKIEKRVT